MLCGLCLLPALRLRGNDVRDCLICEWLGMGQHQLGFCANTFMRATDFEKPVGAVQE